MHPNGLPPVIKLQGLSKVFTTDEVETHALADVSFEIARGDYVSIDGPSGCGKSTLLSILGLLDSPTSGSYELNGREVAELKPWATHPQSGIGFIFQLQSIGACRCSKTQSSLTYRGMRPASGDSADRGARARRQRPGEASAQSAVRRTTATRRGRARSLASRSFCWPTSRPSLIQGGESVMDSCELHKPVLRSA
jgi:putative ABC transport system ATP-binding protein